LHFHFDFRPREPDAPPSYVEQIPLSRYWKALGDEAPRGTYRIAAAPFYFESYYWDGHRWEKLARQRVVPGFLTGLCIDSRFGEVPRSPAFRFANAVHLADADALARAGIDYIAWQKPYRHPSNLVAQPMSSDIAHCEPVLRSRFPVVYEDELLVVFRAPASRGR
jgi:hypothetical protein